MHENEPSVLRGYGSGAVDFLFKPVNPHVLRAKVRIFLELYLSRRAVVREVLAHQKTLAELELSNVALRHFTDAASHDLRAPLRSIRGFLEALDVEAGEKLEAQPRDYLSRSRAAAERMDSLLVSLLAYARLRKRPTQVESDCNQILQHVLADLSDRIQASGAEIEAGKLPVLPGDADRLYQLLLNLIGNALKFRTPGVAPRISIQARANGALFSFSVEDNGIGIEPAHRREIFGAFARLHEQAKFEGAGLGLAICQQIVVQHGGRIWMEPGVPHGSRFCFDLPARVQA
jgi:light-regulated signal transduction histidine kinase (bacteriophytochrome)